VSAYEAAEIFGVTVDAIRKRIQRGAVPHERDDRRVLLDACSTVRDLDQDDYWMTTSDGLVDEMREQVSYLREMLGEEREARGRVDTIIAQLIQANPALATRVPGLETSPGEPARSPHRRPEGPQKVSEGHTERPLGGAGRSRDEP
jgi:hypothetical protein